MFEFKYSLMNGFQEVTSWHLSREQYLEKVEKRSQNILLPGFEPRILDSKSRVITTSLQEKLKTFWKHLLLYQFDDVTCPVIVIQSHKIFHHTIQSTYSIALQIIQLSNCLYFHFSIHSFRYNAPSYIQYYPSTILYAYIYTNIIFYATKFITNRQDVDVSHQLHSSTQFDDYVTHIFLREK